MVIQRWQSVLLFLSSVLSAWLCHAPFAQAEGASIYLSAQPVLLVINVLVAVMSLITIFLFKDLRLQMRVTTVNISVILALIIGIAVSVHSNALDLAWGGALAIASLVCTYAALRLERRDYKLLRSSDRLR